MKRILLTVLALALLAMLCGCGKKKILHCDGCGREVRVEASSNMEEDWIVFCKECERDLGLSSILGE